MRSRPELRSEGLARELVNRIQQRRKGRRAGGDGPHRIDLGRPRANCKNLSLSIWTIFGPKPSPEQLEWAPMGAEVEAEELEPQMTVAIAMVPIQ